MNTPVTLLEAEFPLDKWEGQLKGDQPHLNVEAPAPEKTTLWDGYIKIEIAGSYEIKIGADDYGYFTLGGQPALTIRDNTGNPILSPWNWKRDGTRPSFPTPTSTTSRNPATSRASTPI